MKRSITKTQVLTLTLLIISMAMAFGCASNMSKSDRMLWEGVDMVDTNAPATNAK